MGRINGGWSRVVGIGGVRLDGGEVSSPIFLCELSVLCGRCILCRLLWWWPALNGGVRVGVGGEASGLVGSQWA